MLPPVLTSVEVPEFLSPSAVGSWGECPLRLISASKGFPAERLPSGPDAAIGTLVHRVLEVASTDWGRDSKQAFETELAWLSEELAADPQRCHFADLASTKSLREWSARRAWIQDCFGRIRRSAEERRQPLGVVTDSERTRSIGAIVGAERTLTSQTLRLRGSADLVRRSSSGELEVRDFKSGNVFDEEGEIKAHIKLQLQAYGLMLSEMEPAVEIRLVVDNGDEYPVPFDTAARSGAQALLDGIVRKVPGAG